MTRTGIAAIMVATAVFCSCTGKGPDDSFLRTPAEYSLSVKGRTVFSANPYTCQTSANLKKNEYRVHNDNMSDWYMLWLDSKPVSVGQKVKGSIEWTDGRDVERKNGLTFQVSQVGNTGRVWLWCRKEQIGAIIQPD